MLLTHGVVLEPTRFLDAMCRFAMVIYNVAVDYWPNTKKWFGPSVAFYFLALLLIYFW